ncbi:hypothetical protein BDD12DRAFT_89174 [Trichophaea hybrida]|nr:hypothetical protein BDD12DRAFT_89174 [Trichophaea hybrida]
MASVEVRDGSVGYDDTAVSTEHLKLSGTRFVELGVEGWKPKLNMERESFEALFARTQLQEPALLTITLTDWSLIPFPPLYNDNAPKLEELGWESRINTTSTHFKAVPSASLQKSGLETAAIEFADNELGKLALETGISGVMDLSNAFKKLSTETWLDILDVIQSPQDVLSLCISCTFFYRLCLPRLYRNVRVRAPFHPGDMRWGSTAAFDGGSIPINLLVHPQSPMPPSKFPQLCQLGRYIQRLEINYWDAPPTVPATALPQTIGPNVTTYDMWKGIWDHAPAPQVVQLWLGDPIDPRPLVSVNTVLANLLQHQMQTLRSFSFIPAHSSVKIVFHGNHLSPENMPCLTADVWAALKSLPRLQELTVDFEFNDPLCYGRMADPGQYDAKRDGLVGFTKLVTLDIRGVGGPNGEDLRFPEIAKVVYDCIASETLRNFSLSVEKLWYFLIQCSHLNEEHDLSSWCQDLWVRCFGAVEKRRAGLPGRTPLLNINVAIRFVDVDWKFRCTSGYDLKWEWLTELRIHTGLIFEHAVRHLKKLSGVDLPNLKVLCLKCFVKNVYPLLKSSHGLRELFIINPASVQRLRARDSHNHHHGQRIIAYEECQIQPNVKEANWMMDTIVKNHLRTLEVLVIDEMIPVPYGFQHSGIINSLTVWKMRGMNVKELGLMLWGPWNRVEEFISCFPALKFFHYFNAPKLFYVTPVPNAPLSFQVTSLCAFLHTPYFCDASNTAAVVAHLWAKHLISDRSTTGEGTRWIGIGPWYIKQDSDLRWKWEEDKAKDYLEWKCRPEFYGTLKHAQGRTEKPWHSESRMWRVLSRYIR